MGKDVHRGHGEQISIMDRLIGVFTYISFGWVGFIWLIVTHLTRSPKRPFTLYHALQSIFLGILLVVISMLLNFIYELVIKLPFVGAIVHKFMLFFFATPMYSALNFSIANLLIFILICYLSLGALLGRYSYFPFISEVIKSNVRGQ